MVGLVFGWVILVILGICFAIAVSLPHLKHREPEPKKNIACPTRQFANRTCNYPATHEGLTWEYSECSHGYVWGFTIGGPASIGPRSYVQHMHAGPYYATIHKDALVIFTVDKIILRRPIIWVDGELGLIDNVRVHRKGETFGSFDFGLTLSKENGALFVGDKPLSDPRKPKATKKDQIIRSVVSQDARYLAEFSGYSCVLRIYGPDNYRTTRIFSNDYKCYAKMQKDNNFVIYGLASDKVFWSAGTDKYEGDVKLEFTNEGVLCVMRDNECLQVVSL